MGTTSSGPFPGSVPCSSESHDLVPRLCAEAGACAAIRTVAYPEACPLPAPPARPVDPLGEGSAQEEPRAAAVDVRQGAAAASTETAPRLLDKGAQTEQLGERRPKLTRAQLRARDQIEARLAVWHRARFAAFFVTLTSAPDSPPDKLRYHFKVLRYRLAAHLGIPRSVLEYICVSTREGHGVIHSVVGVPRDCLPNPRILVSFELLQEWWTAIHGAFMVNVKGIRRGKVDRRKVAGYIVAQYLANQEGAYLRLSQSRSAVDWRAWRSEFRRQSWPDRHDVVVRRNRLGAGGEAARDEVLMQARVRAWRKWSWRKWREALRELLGGGACVLWGSAYWIDGEGALRCQSLKA